MISEDDKLTNLLHVQTLGICKCSESGCIKLASGTREYLMKFHSPSCRIPAVQPYFYPALHIAAV